MKTMMRISAVWCTLCAVVSVASLVVVVLGLGGCADTVGTKNAYDANTITQDNPSPSTIVQVSPGADGGGGSTTINTIGPVQQTFVPTPDGEMKSIGGGVANKVIVLRMPDGSVVMVGSQDDANVEFAELRSGGQVIAKGVKFSTNVSDPTRAHADLIKAWGPVYVEALKEARAGNTEKYKAVCSTLEAVAPVALTALRVMYGVP